MDLSHVSDNNRSTTQQLCNRELARLRVNRKKLKKTIIKRDDVNPSFLDLDAEIYAQPTAIARASLAPQSSTGHVPFSSIPT